MNMKIQFCSDQNVQDFRTVSFLNIKFFHMCIGVQICTILLGLGVKTLLIKERYLAK